MVRHYILETFEPDLINISYIGHAYNFKFSAAREAEMWKHWRSSRFYRDYEHIPSVKNVNPLNRKNKFNACMYGFATVYEKIMNLREERSPHRARTGVMYPTSVIDLSLSQVTFSTQRRINRREFTSVRLKDRLYS